MPKELERIVDPESEAIKFNLHLAAFRRRVVRLVLNFLIATDFCEFEREFWTPPKERSEPNFLVV